MGKSSFAAHLVCLQPVGHDAAPLACVPALSQAMFGGCSWRCAMISVIDCFFRGDTRSVSNNAVPPCRVLVPRVPTARMEFGAGICPCFSQTQMALVRHGMIFLDCRFDQPERPTNLGHTRCQTPRVLSLTNRQDLVDIGQASNSVCMISPRIRGSISMSGCGIDVGLMPAVAVPGGLERAPRRPRPLAARSQDASPWPVRGPSPPPRCAATGRRDFPDFTPGHPPACAIQQWISSQSQYSCDVRAVVFEGFGIDCFRYFVACRSSKGLVEGFQREVSFATPAGSLAR